jgi:hypothetical protein
MNGPSDENLAKLAKSLPTMAKGLVEGRIGGKGTTVLRYPRFHCPACMAVWGKPWRRILPDSKPCKTCKKVLTAGGVILISMDDRFVRVTPKPGNEVNPAYKGKIVRVSVAQMDQLHALSASPAAGSPPAPAQSPGTSTPPPASHMLEPVVPPVDPHETSTSSDPKPSPPGTDRSADPPAPAPGECAH